MQYIWIGESLEDGISEQDILLEIENSLDLDIF